MNASDCFWYVYRRVEGAGRQALGARQVDLFKLLQNLFEWQPFSVCRSVVRTCAELG